MSDDIQWMTYAELAEVLGIGADSARNLVRRKRWSRQMGNDGLARIGVPLDQIPARIDPPTEGPIDMATNPTTDGATSPPIEPPTTPDGSLIAIEVLRDHIGRLEAEIATLKEERDQERVRAAQVDALTAILEIERKRADELRQERDRWSAAAEAFQQQLVDLTTRRPRGFLGWLRRA